MLRIRFVYCLLILLTWSSLGAAIQVDPTRRLTLNQTGPGTVEIVDPFSEFLISHEDIEDGITATLRPSPSAGYMFLSFGGCDQVRNGMCTVRMDRDRTVSVSFARSTVSNIRVTPNPASVTVGSSVQLQAIVDTVPGASAPALQDVFWQLLQTCEYDGRSGFNLPSGTALSSTGKFTAPTTIATPRALTCFVTAISAAAPQHATTIEMTILPMPAAPVAPPPSPIPVAPVAPPPLAPPTPTPPPVPSVTSIILTPDQGRINIESGSNLQVTAMTMPLGPIPGLAVEWFVNGINVTAQSSGSFPSMLSMAAPTVPASTTLSVRARAMVNGIEKATATINIFVNALVNTVMIGSPGNNLLVESGKQISLTAMLMPIMPSTTAAGLTVEWTIGSVSQVQTTAPFVRPFTAPVVTGVTTIPVVARAKLNGVVMATGTAPLTIHPAPPAPVGPAF